MKNTKNRPQGFFPTEGLQDLLFDIAGEAIQLDRPSRAGEHAHTVDAQGNVMSLAFRDIFQKDPDPSDKKL